MLICSGTSPILQVCLQFAGGSRNREQQQRAEPGIIGERETERFHPLMFLRVHKFPKKNPQLHVVSAMCTPTDRLMGQVFTGVNVTSILLKPHVLARALGTVAIVMSRAVRSVWAMAVASARTRLSATGGPQCKQNRASRGVS